MKLLASSVDPSKIALTIKGLTALVPLVIVFLSYFKVDVGAEELNTIINQLADLILVLGTVITSAVTLFGLVRKLGARLLNK